MSETWEQILQSVDFKSDGLDNGDSDAKKIAEKNIKYAESLLKEGKISKVEFDRYFNQVIDILKRREADLNTLGQSTQIQINQIKSELNINPESLKDYPLMTLEQLINFKGKASVIYENGTFRGDFVSGIKEGFGTYVWTTGEKYEGEWKKDKMDGPCTFTYPNGDKFRGIFQNGYPFSGVVLNKENVLVSSYSNGKNIDNSSKQTSEIPLSKQEKSLVDRASVYINKTYSPDQIKLLQSILGIETSGVVSQSMVLLIRDFQNKNNISQDGKPGPSFLGKNIGKSFGDLVIVQEKNGKGKIINKPNDTSKPLPNNVDTGIEKPQKKSEINEENLYNGLTGYLDFDKSEKFSIDLKNPVFPEGIDKNKVAEAKKLIELGKGIDGIDDGRVSFTKEGKVILELNTRGSDLYIESVGGKYIVSGQSDGKFFVNEVDTKTFKEFVKNYDSENTKKILEELGFTTGFTFIGVVCFLLRTGIGVFLPGAASLALGAYRGYNLYKLYNLSTNTTVEMGEKLKDKPESLKQYLFLTQVGYITGTGQDGTYKTRDGLTIKESDFKEKYSQIKNNGNEERKYLLLSQLENRGYSPEFIKKENRYELDFDGLFDDSSIKFDGDKASITTSGVKGKTFEVSLEKGNAFKTIANINEYIRISSDLMTLQNNSSSDRNSDISEGKHKDLTKRKEELSKILGIS